MKVLYTYVHLFPIYRKKYWQYGKTGRLKRFLDENKDLIEQDFKEEISDITKINIDVLDFDSLLSFHELLNKDDEKNFFIHCKHRKEKSGEGFFDKDDESDKRLTGKQAYVRWLADYALCLSPDKQKKLLQCMMPCVSMEDTFAYWIWEMVACEVEKNQVCGFLEYLEFATARYFQKM